MKAILSRLLNLLKPRAPALRARYDAAANTNALLKHWANADHLSADAANAPEIRRLLRARCRYEIANNPTAYGMALRLANDVIGTGPRLQLLLHDDTANDRVEAEWGDWATETAIAEKLRTARIAQFQDGEAFLAIITNPRLPTPVKLDILPIEADRVTNPTPRTREQFDADGIILDRWGNPTRYLVLRQHPGDLTITDTGYDAISPDLMIHLFRKMRPEQHRGIPELTPSLPLFAITRDWTIASLNAAKVAAAYAGVIYTDAPPGGEATAVEELEPIPLEQNCLMTMPAGWRMEQMQARHPSDHFAQAITLIEKQAIRSTPLPWNVAAADSSQYNYASGRLDHQTYYRALSVERSEIERIALRKILRAWLREAALIPNYLPVGHGPPATWPYTWFWDGLEHVDPLKEANAQGERLRNNTTTLAAEYAKQGKDWRLELLQRAKELALMRDLGITDDTLTPPQATPYADTDT